mgnify:CR=1 FL=1
MYTIYEANLEQKQKKNIEDTIAMLKEMPDFVPERPEYDRGAFRQYVTEELDAEAIKVVAASPKWKPAKVNGQKVRCSMTVPVEFRLEKKGGKGSFGIKK